MSKCSTLLRNLVTEKAFPCQNTDWLSFNKYAELIYLLDPFQHHLRPLPAAAASVLGELWRLLIDGLVLLQVEDTAKVPYTTWYKPRRQSSYIGGPKSWWVCGPSHKARTDMCDLPADFQHTGGCIAIIIINNIITYVHSTWLNLNKLEEQRCKMKSRTVHSKMQAWKSSLSNVTTQQQQLWEGTTS